MNATATTATAENPSANIIPLDVPPRPKMGAGTRQRFRIIPFKNRNGVRSWRVTGIKRDGERIRENFIEIKAAECRQVELQLEYLSRQAATQVRATKLTDDQCRIAESCFNRLEADDELYRAVDHWLKHGRQRDNIESPKIDVAVEKYLVWLEASPFRDATKRHWKYRMGVFKNSVPNIRVADFTPETIEEFLAKQNVSPVGKDTYRRCVSRFFSWCIERPQRWTTANPCREVKVQQSERDTPPAILTVKECEQLLKSAVEYKEGMLVPYVVVCLFAGLRPTEASRLEWSQVNLKDGELRLESNQTKTGRKSKRGRVVTIGQTLLAWLKDYKDVAFSPANWRKEFDAVKLAAGFGTPTAELPKLKPWPHDVMRHTAISHFFRDSGSYGLTAEQFGNSESVIKAHYQARVSTDDTKKFYALTPSALKKGAK